MITVLAGRRIDAPDAEEKRFPLEMKETVYERILVFLRARNIKAFVSSAACGADLLGQKAARELGIGRHVILPFGREKFRKTSVVDRPGDWGVLFDEICDEVVREGNLKILEGFEDDENEAYSAVTTAILDCAESLRTGAEKILAVAVWDAKAKDERDETASFIEQARRRKIEVETILSVNKIP